ncbi:hypothetical protein H312_00429 [Anncaliia algerae PRA339]|uniref:Uncharacterized protein n=1 Tax=Anncaliia algerae PRA339 TaxID=1288291 RepID=A0A059F4Y5_9MICR|nr:hypothetical protein H312_00429 [Anncaliia algerae PRA339]
MKKLTDILLTNISETEENAIKLNKNQREETLNTSEEEWRSFDLTNQVNYNLSTILKDYDQRFDGIGQRYSFKVDGKDISKVIDKENEIYIKFRNINSFNYDISSCFMLKRILISGCNELDISLLTNNSLKEIKFKNIEEVISSEGLSCNQLRSLIISKCSIQCNALIDLLNQHKLTELFLKNLKITKLEQNTNFLEIFGNMKYLKAIYLENIFSELFFDIFALNNCNFLHFISGEMVFKYDLTLKTGPFLQLTLLSEEFYNYPYKNVKCLVYQPSLNNISKKFILSFEENTRIFDLILTNTCINKGFLKEYFNYFSCLVSFKIINCEVDFYILFHFLTSLKSTLRYLEIVDFSLPVDFITRCNIALKNCKVVYGSNKNEIYIK